MFDQFRSETQLFDEQWLGDEPETRTLELDSPEGSVRIRYWDSSPTLDGDKPAEALASAGSRPTSLVLTHGLFDSKRVWRYVWWPLARQSRLVAADLPGMGLSDKPKLSHLPRAERYTPAWLAGQLRHIVHAVGGLDGFVLVGHSLGGALSLLSLTDEAFARRVRALVLIAAAGYPQALPRYVARYNGWRGAVMACPLWHDWLAAWAIRHGRGAHGVKAAYRLCVHDAQAVPREALEASLRMASSPGFPYAARTIARRLVPRDHARLVERFKQVTLPTLVIWGRDDRVVPPEHAGRFGRDLPNARVVMYDGCGHWPQYERARETARDIQRFIEEIAQPHSGGGENTGG